jgi:hypothetical protein
MRRRTTNHDKYNKGYFECNDLLTTVIVIPANR